MVRSMTGFGKAHLTTPDYALHVELRAVNNRSLKVVCRLPDTFLGREMDIERILRQQVTRGTVYVSIDMENLAGEPGYSLDAAAIKAYHRDLTCLKRELGDNEPVRVESLLLLPGTLVKSKSIAHVSDAIWEKTTEILRQALAEFVRMREQEGAFIWQSISEHCARIEHLLDHVESQLPQAIAEFRARLTARLDELLAGRSTTVEQAAIDREVALLADKSDVAEELNRLRSHVQHLKQAPQDAEPCGRKLEFIIQEMFREANTMASKVNNEHLIRNVLELKNEIDKLREQAQNVE